MRWSCSRERSVELLTRGGISEELPGVQDSGDNTVRVVEATGGALSLSREVQGVAHQVGLVSEILGFDCVGIVSETEMDGVVL